MNSLLHDIKDAAVRIRPYVLKTPLLESLYLSKLTNSKVYLKLENEQLTGSFKVRGATNKILTLTAQQKKNGVITASTGNHGLALARALQITKLKGIVVVPKNADKAKVNAIEQYGAEVIFYGDTSSDTITHAFAKKIAKEKRLTWVSPYNDPAIIAGQGTIAVEMIEQLKDIAAVFVTIGGGGLISGIGTYIKSVSPNTKIIGCLPENSAEMYESIKSGKFVDSHNKDTISDGSGGGFEEGAITYDICKDVVDDFILVSENEIKDAIKMMADVHHKIIEGAAGVALASFLKKEK